MILPCGHVANRKWKQGAEHWCSEPGCRRWYRMSDEAPPATVTVRVEDLRVAIDLADHAFASPTQQLALDRLNEAT